MASKRKSSALGLQRRVKARKDEEWESELANNSEQDSSNDDDVSEDGVRGEHDESDSELGSDAESDSDEDAPTAGSGGKVDLSSISFGALARAQASMPSKLKGSKTMKNEKGESAEESKTLEPAPRARTLKPKDEPKPKRSSKHAPQEQTSKKPVSRRREITLETKRQHRDPRFDPLAGPLDEEKAKRAYAFLDEYRDKEMAELRAQIRKTKDPYAKEDLKRQVMSMESKKKADKKKEDEQRLLQDHRKKEKELVAQGKTPFYLKKSEQKKQLLTNRYASMSKGQVDRAIERKRKKVAGKEKKEFDYLVRSR